MWLLTCFRQRTVSQNSILLLSFFIFLLSAVYAYGWIVPALMTFNSAEQQDGTHQYLVPWAAYHLAGVQAGLGLLFLLHTCRHAYQFLRRYLMALALAYPLVCYAARQSCGAAALHDAFVWAVPVSFCWVLCDGALGALKWIWGAHFGTIVVLTALAEARIGECAAAPPAPGDSASVPFAVINMLMATLVPQGLCVVAALFCFREYRRNLVALQSQISFAEKFVHTLERFALEEATTIPMDLELPLHRHLNGVLEQLHILKPFLPHTLFAQETHDDSNEDLPSTNPLDRPPRQVSEKCAEDPCVEDPRTTAAEVPDISISPRSAMRKRLKKLRLEPLFVDQSTVASSPAAGDRQSISQTPRPPILRTPVSGRHFPGRRMSQMSTYESLPHPEPRNPFVFDADKEFLDVISGVPDPKPPTPKPALSKSRWPRRRFSSRVNSQSLIPDMWCRKRDSIQRSQRVPTAADDAAEQLGVNSMGTAEEEVEAPATPPREGKRRSSSKACSFPKLPECFSPRAHNNCLLQRAITLLYVNLCNVNDIARRHCTQVEGLLDATTNTLFDVVTRNRGTVVTFSGGRLLATWNAASRMPSHAQKAVQCALQMHEELGKLAGGWTKAGIRVSARIAITTCTATFGHVGRLHASYNVLGPGLGVVQALDQLCKQLRLRTVLTDVTADLCKYAFQVRPVDVVRIDVPGCEAVQTKVYELQGPCAETGAGEEWMYEMQERHLLEEKDFDRGFHLLCEGDLLGAQLLFELQARAAPTDPTALRLLRLCEYFRDHPEGRRRWRPPYVRRLVGPWQRWGPEEPEGPAHLPSTTSFTTTGSFRIPASR